MSDETDDRRLADLLDRYADRMADLFGQDDTPTIRMLRQAAGRLRGGA